MYYIEVYGTTVYAFKAFNTFLSHGLLQSHWVSAGHVSLRTRLLAVSKPKSSVFPKADTALHNDAQPTRTNLRCLKRAKGSSLFSPYFGSNVHLPAEVSLHIPKAFGSSAIRHC